MATMSKAKNVSAGVAPQNKKKVGSVDAKGAYTEVQKRTLGNMKMGGELKTPTPDQKGLKALPTPVRNKMGFKKNGGAMKKAMMGSAMSTSPMMKKGGKMSKKK